MPVKSKVKRQRYVRAGSDALSARGVPAFRLPNKKNARKRPAALSVVCNTSNDSWTKLLHSAVAVDPTQINQLPREIAVRSFKRKSQLLPSSFFSWSFICFLPTAIPAIRRRCKNNLSLFLLFPNKTSSSFETNLHSGSVTPMASAKYRTTKPWEGGGEECSTSKSRE